ncbi:MAG: GIY-YIG nuclease family protein [Bacteroidetes bacterium]|nr:GIY-YIG nuclease family protein [Bacteroidota bacterium]
MSFYVYILESATGRLYIGQTNDLSDRLVRHNSSHIYMWIFYLMCFMAWEKKKNRGPRKDKRGPLPLTLKLRYRYSR